MIPQDYKPIGLCKVIYEIIAKFVANRVKDHLPDYINPAQYAFIANSTSPPTLSSPWK
jgi:hypothetical protein